MKPTLYVTTRNQWRAWLKENHGKTNELWLVFYKKKTGKPSINYIDAVEEALCFGWIDGLKKSIDDQKYAYRFSPRTARSKWSAQNIELANQMIAQKKMTAAGLKAFEQRVPYDDAIIKARNSKQLTLTPELEKNLKSNKKAWENFNNLAPGYQKQYVTWLLSVKKPETREKRLKQAIKLLQNNKKPGMI